MARQKLSMCFFMNGQYARSAGTKTGQPEVVGKKSGADIFFERFERNPRITLGESNSGMKILLRDQKTKLYYAGEQGWKLQPGEAVSFPSSVNAWRLVLANFHGEPVELVYWFADSADSIFVPIEPPLRQAR